MLSWYQLRKIERLLPQNEEPTRKGLNSLLCKSFKVCKAECEFLLSRPDILSSLARLFTGVIWEHDGPEDEFRETYVFPFASFMHSVLLQARNLRIMSITGIIINNELSRTILTLPHLHTVTISCCGFQAFSVDLPLNHSILNVHLHPSEMGDDFESPWKFTTLCANLSVLDVNNEECPMSIFHEEIVAQHNPFKSLTRLVLHRIHPIAVSNFASALRRHTAKFTHLKLDITYGLVQDEVVELLESLRGVAVQYFVLNGTFYAELDLFDLISESMPDLLSLTVVRRESLRQTEAKLAMWPYASWEYASHFVHFRKLQHFGWNFAAPEEDIDFCAATLLGFEEGFPDDAWRSHAAGDNLNEDWKSITRVLAAYCSSLRAVTQIAKFFPSRQCKIVRDDAHGTASISETDSPFDTIYKTEYNPDVLDKEWDVDCVAAPGP